HPAHGPDRCSGWLAANADGRGPRCRSRAVADSAFFALVSRHHEQWRGTTMGNRTRVPVAAVALALAQASAFAGGGTWPGAAPCHTTLQACLDATAENDIVNVATDGPINENIVLAASRGLVAMPGYSPVFAPGRSLTASSSGAGGFSILLRRFTLNDGYVQLTRAGSGNADFRVEDMTLNSTSNAANTRIR